MFTVPFMDCGHADAFYSGGSLQTGCAADRFGNPSSGAITGTFSELQAAKQDISTHIDSYYQGTPAGRDAALHDINDFAAIGVFYNNDATAYFDEFRGPDPTFSFYEISQVFFFSQGGSYYFVDSDGHGLYGASSYSLSLSPTTAFASTRRSDEHGWDVTLTNPIDEIGNRFEDADGRFLVSSFSWTSPDFTFSADPSAPGSGGGGPSVPEPATWAMMLLGFGIVGWSVRRVPGAVRATA